MRSKHCRLPGLGALLGVALCASLGLAWKSDSPFEVHVHDHLFDRAVLESDGCMLNVALYFTAPDKLYANADATKNFYRFHARLRFQSGQEPRISYFHNRAAGRRVYRTQVDSTSEGCWAKSEPKLAGVDVEGCRGRRCKPQEFD